MFLQCTHQTISCLVIKYVHFTSRRPFLVLSAAGAAKSIQSCPTLCDPMDCSLPGSSIHGIFRATVLEWGAIAFSQFFQELQIKIMKNFSSLINLFQINVGLPRILAELEEKK